MESEAVVRLGKPKELGGLPDPPPGSDFDFVINGIFHGLGTPVSSGTPTYCLAQHVINSRNPITQIACSIVKTSPAPTEPLIIGLVPGNIVGTDAFFNLDNWHIWGTVDQSILPEFNTPYWVAMQTDITNTEPLFFAVVTNQTDTRWYVSIIENGNEYVNFYRYCQNSQYCDDGWNDFAPYDMAVAIYSYAPPTPCSDYNQTECEPAGCWWWNGSCHDDQPTSCSQLNNQSDCGRWDCFWYDGSCHSSPQQTDPIIYEFLSCDCTDYEQCWDHNQSQCENDPNCNWRSSSSTCRPKTAWNWHPPAKNIFQVGERVWCYARIDCDYPTSWGCGGWNGRYLKMELWREGGSNPEYSYTWGPIGDYTSYSINLWLSNWSDDNYIVKLYWGDTSSCPNYLGYMTFTILAPPCSNWTNQPDCTSHGCYWWNNSCHDSHPTTCEELNNQSDCTDYECFWFQDIDPPYEWRCHSICYWWDGECHERPPNCNEILNSGDCDAWGCYWYNGVCNSDPQICSDYMNQTDCETADCYWWNGSCHDLPPSCEELNSYADCVTYECYWWDESCHSEPEDWGLCRWISDQLEQPGGPPLPIYEIPIQSVMALIDSFVLQRPPNSKPYNFIPTILEVFGVIDYYLGFDGDAATGCDFVP